MTIPKMDKTMILKHYMMQSFKRLQSSGLLRLKKTFIKASAKNF